MIKRIKNIGILAHVDAGKTTITENFLYLAKAIKKLGNVDQGSSVTDSMVLEKERGISIRSASVSFQWKDCLVNLIDTPGHADFSSEVERSLAVLDGVILVVSAVEGVQSHTITLWEAIGKSGKPCLIFINKIDRSGSDFLEVLQQMKKELSPAVFALCSVENEGGSEARPVYLFQNNNTNTQNLDLQEKSIESLAEVDEEILTRYLDGEKLGWDIIEKKLISFTPLQKILPVYCGAAKYSCGMETLLDAVIRFIPDAKTKVDAETTAIVYKLDHDKVLGKLAHVRVFSGHIKSRDLILNSSKNNEEKVAQLKKFLAGKMTDITEIQAGDIGIITGMHNVEAGDILGNEDLDNHLVTLQEPVITIQVKTLDDTQYSTLAEALLVLNSEDPSLGYYWIKETREMHLNLMGMIQVEILQSVLEHRFGIKAKFLEPTVIYKETPAGVAEGYIEYTLPKPCWAIMTFKVEPASKGAGIIYQSEVGVNDIHKKYQNEVEQTIAKSLTQGLKGWEVTDIKITLMNGEDHEIHSRPGDFILATPMGIMRALEKAGTKLLEPVYKFEISAPEEFLGAIAGDLTKLRAQFESPEFENEKVQLTGVAPVSDFISYHIRLSSLTGGRGRIRTQFGGYKECPDEFGKVRTYVGVNPLDTSQWILHKRGAYKANERRF